MEKFVKKKKISELKEGDFVDDIFFVKFKKGMAAYAKGFSFELMLSDSSGLNLDYKYWGGIDEARVKALYISIKADSIVHVQGRMSSYREKLQLATNEPNIIEVLKEGQFDASDFVKAAKKDGSLLYSQVLEYIDAVENPKIKALLNNVFKEIGPKFKTHPAAIEIHHNWVGGLLEHTLEVLNYCKLSWEMFSLDKDLLIAGALLHDVGKLEEIEVTSRIKGTSKGQLTGHLMLGTIYVSKKCDEVAMDPEMKDKILHLMISHHGHLEYGSPKEPMFPEAFVLYYADEMSSKIAEMTEFKEEAKLSTEDDFMFHRRNGRNILLK